MVHLATYYLSQDQVLSPQVKGRTDNEWAGRSVCGGEQRFVWTIWTLCLSDMMDLIFFFFLAYLGTNAFAQLFVVRANAVLHCLSLLVKWLYLEIVCMLDTEIKIEVLCFDNRCTWSKYICNIDEHFCQIISYAMYLVNIFSRITFVYNIPNRLQSLKKKKQNW